MIEFGRTNSFIKVLAGGTNSGKSGQGLSACYWDEICTVSNDEPYHQLYHSGKFRKQPIWMCCSTPQANRMDLGGNEYRYASRILNSENDDPDYLAVIVGIPDHETKWKDPNVWWKYLAPLDDCLINKEWYLNEFEKAQDDPRAMVRFKNHCLCMWSEAENALFSLKKIEATQVDFSEEELHGERCFVGFDGAKSYLASMVLYFPDHQKAIARFWHPHDTAVRTDKNEGTKYQAYAAEHHIKLTEGNLMCWDTIRRQILQDTKDFDIQDFGFDPEALEFRIQDFAAELPYPVVPVLPYANHVARPTRYMETLINSETLKIKANPLAVDNLRHCVCEPEDKQGRIILSHKLAKGLRYDMASALVLALHRYLTAEDNSSSVKGGIIF